MDRKYFPERLQHHIASLEDSQGSLSDPEIDSPPTVGLDADPPDPRLQLPPSAPRAAKSPRKGAKSQEGESAVGRSRSAALAPADASSGSGGV